MVDTSEVSIRRNDSESRYELTIDGRLASRAEFEVDGNVVRFTHTVTTPAMRGNGFAERLIRFALDDVRARGQRVVARCWFVTDYIANHPDDQALLAPTGFDGPR